MAVTVDIGDRHNVHPKDKQDVGDRLTRIALAQAYGQDIEFSGPVYESLMAEGRSLRLHFSHLGGGLVARGGPLQTFAVAGADGKYIPATAMIEGDAVVVSAPSVPAPSRPAVCLGQLSRGLQPLQCRRTAGGAVPDRPAGRRARRGSQVGRLRTGKARWAGT